MSTVVLWETKKRYLLYFVLYGIFQGFYYGAVLHGGG